EPVWGARINRQDNGSHSMRARPTGCPEWVESPEWDRWYKRGLVVWDNVAHRIGAIAPGEAIALSESLQASEAWKTQGSAVIERSTRLSPGESSPSKRSRRKKVAPEVPPDPPEPKYALHEDERLRLTGSIAEEFHSFLQANEPFLRQMVEEDTKRYQAATDKVFNLMLKFHQEEEVREFDPSSRELHWIIKEQPLSLVCDVPPDRITIKISDNNLFWQPIIERPNRLKHDWQRFLYLKEALDWAEQELPKLRAEEDEFDKTREQAEAEGQAKISSLPTLDLSPYWIDPTQLDPKRITYRVIIEMEYEPYRYQTVEISFGQHWRHGEEFYPPSMLARELQLPINQVEVEQRIEGMGWYTIRSAVTYYELSLTTAQAQHLWDSSAITQRYQEKKVIRARYGVEEVETGYDTWLGGVEQSGKSWPAPKSRSEYLQRRAMREILLYALDVNGYRQFTQLSFKYFNDEHLLERMHNLRVHSAYIPDEARAESRQWLAAHG
ncbi:MAG TPA: hypothetical protein VJ020_00630, partial [Anaerolineales bacterium]|nr:hypothetical protein [Anaerolineales bacterium]